MELERPLSLPPPSSGGIEETDFFLIAGAAGVVQNFLDARSQSAIQRTLPVSQIIPFTHIW